MLLLFPFPFSPLDFSPISFSQRRNSIVLKSSDRAAMRVVVPLLRSIQKLFVRLLRTIFSHDLPHSKAVLRLLRTVSPRISRLSCPDGLRDSTAIDSFQESFLVQSLRLTVVRPPPPAFPNAITCWGFFFLFLSFSLFYFYYYCLLFLFSNPVI